VFDDRPSTDNHAGTRRSSRIQESYKDHEVNYNENNGWGKRLRAHEGEPRGQIEDDAHDRPSPSEPQISTKTTSPTKPSPEPEMTPYNDLPPERQSRADEYIRTLTAIETEAEAKAQFQFAADTDNRKCQTLTKQLPAIERKEIEVLGEAELIHERAIKAASMKRDRFIKDLKAYAEAEREKVRKLRAECIAGVQTREARISEINAVIEDLRKRKLALETEGGFQLGLDVGLMKRAKKG
jgi:hypothetical protein